MSKASFSEFNDMAANIPRMYGMLNFTKHISVKIAEESIKETILISKLDVECEADEEEMLKS